MVKIRLASRPVNAVIQKATDEDLSKQPQQNYKGTAWKITFESPVRAVAPGQSVVLYDEGVIRGGGIISSTF